MTNIDYIAFGGFAGIVIGAIGLILAYILGYGILLWRKWRFLSLQYAVMQMILIIMCPLLLYGIVVLIVVAFLG